MVASPLEDTFLLMLLLREYYFEKAVAKSVLLRLWTRPVSFSPRFLEFSSSDVASDCPEREATYIITSGGINDPEKA